MRLFNPPAGSKLVASLLAFLVVTFTFGARPANADLRYHEGAPCAIKHLIPTIRPTGGVVARYSFYDLNAVDSYVIAEFKPYNAEPYAFVAHYLYTSETVLSSGAGTYSLYDLEALGFDATHAQYLLTNWKPYADPGACPYVI